MDNETSPEDEASRASNSNSHGLGASGSSSTDDGPKPGHSLDRHVGQGPPIPTPSLARSLQALSTPRLSDNLEPGQVEQLPSEGKAGFPPKEFYEACRNAILTYLLDLQCGAL